MPADNDIAARWHTCLTDWLNQIERRSGAPNTRRAYEADVKDFFAFIKREPWEITGVHAEHWAQELTRRQLATSTIRRKLSALSSYYAYASEYPSLADHRNNPFASRSLRPQRQELPVAFPTSQQLLDLLATISTDNITGLRNRALITGLILTCRRINEFVGLRGADFTHVGRLHWFSYRLKGGDWQEQQLPDSIWQLIEQYLRAADRWPLPAEAYVFIAFSDNGERLNHRDGDGPLNPGYVSRLIKRYGQAAGIPEACLYPHALRHAGAQLRREMGSDILDLQRILGHKNPQTTIGYLRRLERPHDARGETIADFLLRRVAPGGEAR